MKGAFRPEGYPQMSPYLMVAGSVRLLQFLTQAFDAVPLRRFDAPDRTIMHMEVLIGDSVVMFAEGSDSFPAFPAWIHLYYARCPSELPARTGGGRYRGSGAHPEGG